MPQQPNLGWNPARTWAFVVGTLQWKHSEYFTSFPQENRRDAALVKLFGEIGIPAAQISYLQDRQATTQQIQQAFETLLAKAQPGDTLIVYYCGHGAKQDDGTAYFVSYDADGDTNSGWVVETIPATIERCFGGARALLLADCCYSGALAEAITTHVKKVAYACLASSLASEVSTGNWTFTEGLLAGLTGQAFVDADRNAAITLRELAMQITDTMAFAEEQIVTFATTPGFDPNLVVAAARPRSDEQIGKHVAVLSEKTWYLAQIVAVKGAKLQVHFYGYEASDDQWVTQDAIRSVARPAYPIGATVEVQWKRRWFLATIRDGHAGIHLIEYEGYGPEWNEWVAFKRIRPIV